jgi:hypothetical protein
MERMLGIVSCLIVEFMHIPAVRTLEVEIGSLIGPPGPAGAGSEGIMRMRSCADPAASYEITPPPYAVPAACYEESLIHHARPQAPHFACSSCSMRRLSSTKLTGFRDAMLLRCRSSPWYSLRSHPLTHEPHAPVRTCSSNPAPTPAAYMLRPHCMAMQRSQSCTCGLV